jgi:hypothetical protein
MQYFRTAVWVAAAVVCALPASAPRADLIDHMTLHGFCGASAAASTCSDNGTITPTNQNPLLQFGFNRSPDSNNGLTTPTFELVALVPSANPAQTITYTGSGGGISGTVTLGAVAGVFGSGDLDAFLNLTRIMGGGPANPIGGFQDGETNQGLPSTGFDVYTGTFGTPNFDLATDPTFVPGGAFTGTLPVGTELYALLLGPSAGQRQDATALSGTLIVVSSIVTTQQPIPEPSTLALVGGALAALGFFRRRRSA